jgi:23S rRNA (cytidine1920-2'-O)/16S rRNA (cytidine1409-2'-O)-methyltransferase
VTPRERADRLLVARGLFETRAQAQSAIAAGLVMADGRPVAKASDLLAPDAALAATPPHPWVSRGGVKLAAALDTFGVDPKGRVCLDIGASTGGFTDVLIARGAEQVIAVDVGTAQMHPRLAGHPRVRLLERTDARDLASIAFDEPPSLLVADVAFVSLLKVTGPALACLAPGADMIALIKPQFEVGRANVGKGGRVAEADALAARDRVVSALAQNFGLGVRGVIDSPIAGGDGNREYLVHARLAQSSVSVPAMVMPKPSSPT